MKAISLWQPWAQAMALGVKRNETRSWPTSYRGDLVICSSKKKMDDVAFSVARSQGFNLDEMPLGCAVCVVEVVGCFQTETMKPELRERTLGDYSPGRWAWLTINLRRLKTPVPVIGHQGLWELPEAAEASVRYFLPLNADLSDRP